MIPIHMNPVYAGLVDEAQHYRYPSRDYSGQKGLLEIVNRVGDTGSRRLVFN